MNKTNTKQTQNKHKTKQKVEQITQQNILQQHTVQDVTSSLAVEARVLKCACVTITSKPGVAAAANINRGLTKRVSE
jgi:hypothetical protein